MKLDGQKVRFKATDGAQLPPNRAAKRKILGALRRAKRQAKRQNVRALKRGFGKVYDALAAKASASGNAPKLNAEGTPLAPIPPEVPASPVSENSNGHGWGCRCDQC